ncbi:hypothetical protein BDZ91DRAFT_689614 [Kalaharituber pfeilii]|nr:hypothetical protein BDZ91DRAFT_689614 [Kalaharituber pfeilii]
MAANANPDSQLLTNWEQAFESYSIPQVRSLHRQIQNDLGVNREKLRALVGESYRDLLRTAEKIIEMDASAQTVENNLADASRSCNYRLMERKARNVKMFYERVEGRDQERNMLAAQIAVLQGCPTELSNALHKDSSCLLAARIFVVSRLVLKSLQEKGAGAYPMVASLRDQLTALRGILLRHIDHQLRLASNPTKTLIESMCALTLVKTSSPADLIRHFLSVRSNAISSTLNPDTLNSDAILDALGLFNSTLQEAEAVFPKRISEALHQLKSKSLFENLDLKAVPSLNLDTNEKWLPEDIRGFVPWVRHDELEKSRVNDSVKTWANRELETLNTSIKQALGNIESIGAVVSLREDILDLWRRNKSHLLHVVIGSEGPKRRFRELLNARIEQLLDTTTKTLDNVGAKVQKLATNLEKGEIESSMNLWSEALLSVPLSNGASLFRKNVKATIVGQNSLVKVVINEYQNWGKLIIHSLEFVESIRKLEVKDEFDDDNDFALGSDALQDGTEDSEQLEKYLKQSVQNAYKALEGDLEKLVQECEAVLPMTLTDTTKSIFLLRSIRHLRQHPPSTPSGNIISIGWFSRSLITRLQNVVSRGVSSEALSLFQRSLRRRNFEKECPSVPLWEGSPHPLPTQPSPDVFKFLHQMVTVMSKAGSDIWTPATVAHIRGIVRNELCELVRKEIDNREVKAETDAATEKGKREENDESQQKPDKAKSDDTKVAQNESEAGGEVSVDQDTVLGDKIETSPDADSSAISVDPIESATPAVPVITVSWARQLIYDLSYLLTYALPASPSGSEDDRVTAFKNRFNALDDREYDKIQSSAGEYWKRTSLLFSLLA